MNLDRLRAQLEAIVESSDPSVSPRDRLKASEQLLALFGEDLRSQARRAAEAKRREDEGPQERLVGLNEAVNHAWDVLFLWLTDPDMRQLFEIGDTGPGEEEDAESAEAMRQMRAIADAFERRVDQLVQERAEARAEQSVMERGA